MQYLRIKANIFDQEYLDKPSIGTNKEIRN